MNKLGSAFAVAAIATFGAQRAAAFDLLGHEMIEAAAYRRLLALQIVPGTGTPGVSGRTLLATLIADGVLVAPPCFDRERPIGGCGPAERLDLPLGYWPVLGSGRPDLIIDRQLGQRGQCQHFMARTADGLAPLDPRLGVPGDLVTTAYRRCIQVLGLAFDKIVRDPRRAQWHVIGPYVLMHGIEDAFSAAHAARDDRGVILHLLSWSLIDWPRYLVGGRFAFPPGTHHAISDARDGDYLRREGQARDGRPCRAFEHPYAVPPECLSARGSAAVDAVTDYLILLYRARAGATADGQALTIFARSPEISTLWLDFVHAHLPSVTEPPDLPRLAFEDLPRPDVFLGAQASGAAHRWNAGVWASRLFVGPALPFVLGPTVAAGYARAEGQGRLVGSAGVALMLPLVRRLAIGATPAGVRVACDTQGLTCTIDPVARLGELLVPLTEQTWLGIEGPVWSWADRRISDASVGVAFGWSQERLPAPHPFAPEAAASWDPPRFDQVHAFRQARVTRLVFLTATAGSAPNNQFVGAGLDARLDRDEWDRHSGFGAGLEVEIDAGHIDGATAGGAVGLAPTVRYYLLPDRLALVATPALVRMGALGGRAFAVDVAARAGLALCLGRLELAVESPLLSYVDSARWHALPLTARLGLALD